MNNEPIHARLGNQHRWVYRETYSVTQRQAVDLNRKVDVKFAAAALINKEINCFDCGETLESKKKPCLSVIR